MTNDVLNDLGITDFDPASELETPEQVTAFLQACMDEAPEDAAFIAHALGVVARAQTRMAVIAGKSGLSRESLYKALSGRRDPSFSTVLKVLSGLGIHIKFCWQKSISTEAPPPSLEPVTFDRHTLVESMMFVPMALDRVVRAATTSDALGHVLDISGSRQTAGSGADTKRFDIVFDRSDDLRRFSRKGKNVLTGATSGHVSVLPEFAQLSSSHQH